MSDPIEIETVEDSLFRPHVNTEFTIRCDDDVVPLTLEEISEYPDHRNDDSRYNQMRKPFGLVFKCEAGVVGQGIYQMEHGELPPFEAFLSPFDGGEGWCKLEAIFN